MGGSTLWIIDGIDDLMDEGALVERYEVDELSVLIHVGYSAYHVRKKIQKGVQKRAEKGIRLDLDLKEIAGPREEWEDA